MIDGDRNIRAAEPADASAVAEIYNYYIKETVITFEEEPVTPSEMTRRIAEVQSASLPWLIAEDKGEITGYAYAKLWQTRRGYRFSAEITVYVAPEHSGRGFGSLLYSHLIPLLEARHMHSIIGGIALPNDASIALHEKFGFRKVAHYFEVGFKFNRWIDVGYWQRTL